MLFNRIECEIPAELMDGADRKNRGKCSPEKWQTHQQILVISGLRKGASPSPVDKSCLLKKPGNCRAKRLKC
jgi:hypothetical protein